jgi:hypothetical protein
VQFGVGGPLLSVVVNEDAVDGVIGGGDKGVVGDNGHRNLGLGSSLIGKGCEMTGTALLGLWTERPDPTTCCEADRMRCFRATTGLDSPRRLLPLLPPVSGGDRGVAGVRGVLGVEEETVLVLSSW